MALFKFLVDESKCMNCGACMDLCPTTCIEFTRPYDTTFYGDIFPQPVDNFPEGSPKLWMMEKPFVPMEEGCTGCQVCVRECPTNAITVQQDLEKLTLRPRPVILNSGEKLPEDDGLWHPLSEYTTDYLKRPVRSPWSKIADWRPMTKERGVSQTWRAMEKE